MRDARRSRGPFRFDASGCPCPPAVSPSQTLPLCTPPGYGTLQSSGRGRLLGGPRFLYAPPLGAVLGASLQRYRKPSAPSRTVRGGSICVQLPPIMAAPSARGRRQPSASCSARSGSPAGERNIRDGQQPTTVGPLGVQDAIIPDSPQPQRRAFRSDELPARQGCRVRRGAVGSRAPP